MNSPLLCEIIREKQAFLDCEEDIVISIKQNVKFLDKLQTFMKTILKNTADTSLIFINFENKSVW